MWVRDVQKQWYVNGISATVSSIDALVVELRSRVGARRVVTVGSSAGGYAAALFGVLLGAERAICFSAQFDLELAAMQEGGQRFNKLLFDHRSDPRRARYYQVRKLIEGGDTPIFYFFATMSPVDVPQYETVVGSRNLFPIPIIGRAHGIPCWPFNLGWIVNSSADRLRSLSGRCLRNPAGRLGFSLRTLGLYATGIALVGAARNRLARRMARHPVTGLTKS